MAVIRRLPFREVLNKSQCMDCPPGQKKVTVVGRWPLAEDRLYIEMYVTFLHKPKPVEKTS